MNASELFPTPTRTYKTRENAEKHFQKVMAKAKSNGGCLVQDDHYHYMIAATQEGRFFVVVRLRQEQADNSDFLYFCDNGICTC